MNLETQIALIISSIALVISLYGASLSTYNAIVERRREKRQIKVILEFTIDEFDDQDPMAKVIIINVGHRPVTIVDLGISIIIANNKKEEVLGSIIASSITQNRPITLEDGEFISLPLGEGSGKALADPNLHLKISVYDVEGNVYTDFTSRIYDKTYGHFRKDSLEI